MADAVGYSLCRDCLAWRRVPVDDEPPTGECRRRWGRAMADLRRWRRQNDGWVSGSVYVGRAHPDGRRGPVVTDTWWWSVWLDGMRHAFCGTSPTFDAARSAAVSAETKILAGESVGGAMAERFVPRAVDVALVDASAVPAVLDWLRDHWPALFVCDEDEITPAEYVAGVCGVLAARVLRDRETLRRCADAMEEMRGSLSPYAADGAYADVDDLIGQARGEPVSEAAAESDEGPGCPMCDHPASRHAAPVIGCMDCECAWPVKGVVHGDVDPARVFAARDARLDPGVSAEQITAFRAWVEQESAGDLDARWSLSARDLLALLDRAGGEKRGPCGMRWHASDCDCGGVGGDR